MPCIEIYLILSFKSFENVQYITLPETVFLSIANTLLQLFNEHCNVFKKFLMCCIRTTAYMNPFEKMYRMTPNP